MATNTDNKRTKYTRILMLVMFALLLGLYFWIGIDYDSGAVRINEPLHKEGGSCRIVIK